MLNKALFSSASDEWATPPEFMRALGVVFALDVCATPENAKAPKFYTKTDDGLNKDWKRDAGGGAVWMNPPYSQIGAWMETAQYWEECGVPIVALVPARTDTAWFQDSVQHATGVALLRGRIKFGGGKYSAPFPSTLFYFGFGLGPVGIYCWDWRKEVRP